MEKVVLGSLFSRNTTYSGEQRGLSLSDVNQGTIQEKLYKASANKLERGYR